MEGLVGLRPGRGAIRINGKPRQFPHVDASLKAGSPISARIERQGPLLAEDLRVNLTLASLDKFRRWLQIDRAKGASPRQGDRRV
jgi:ribose transport system ATP-binding protein